jgi:hypothetical protein
MSSQNNYDDFVFRLGSEVKEEFIFLTIGHDLHQKISNFFVDFKNVNLP